MALGPLTRWDQVIGCWGGGSAVVDTQDGWLLHEAIGPDYPFPNAWGNWAEVAALTGEPARQRMGMVVL